MDSFPFSSLPVDGFYLYFLMPRLWTSPVGLSHVSWASFHVFKPLQSRPKSSVWPLGHWDRFRPFKWFTVTFRLFSQVLDFKSWCRLLSQPTSGISVNFCSATLRTQLFLIVCECFILDMVRYLLRAEPARMFDPRRDPLVFGCEHEPLRPKDASVCMQKGTSTLLTIEPGESKSQRREASKSGSRRDRREEEHPSRKCGIVH
jgi:hypothetical protein